jgi:4-amino-4-deoxy-L-arabinose transferase-like glycosyltransferase
MRLTTDQVNYLNIGLMVVSCVLAYIFPFELFLFSYAVLGPLHYLTEISWLHDRKYFVEAKRARDAKSRRAWLILVIVTLAVMLYGFIAEKVLKQNVTPVWEIALFYLVFVTAALLWPRRKKATRVVVIALTVILLVFFSSSRYYFLIAFFLITIIHVLIFTAAFILFGALKSRSRSGVLSLVVLFVCGASFFVYAPTALRHTVGDYVRNSYGSFQTLNAELIKISSLGTGASLKEVYESTAGLIVMRLIAFAYTYHYLNWFSKTSIIKWHEIPKSRTAIIICVWFSALVLYGYSYQAGMGALYFLSVLHVMLEFPLNHHTFAGIGRELYAMARYPTGP